MTKVFKRIHKKKRQKTKKLKSKLKCKWLWVLLFLFIPTKMSYQAIKKNIPLGEVRVTRYTHFEGGKVTASGYILKPEDKDVICAVGRDWFKKTILVGDKLQIEGFSRPCNVQDTMAIANRKGLKQTRWVDIYHTDVKDALKFGIQRRRAYLIKE